MSNKNPGIQNLLYRVNLYLYCFQAKRVEMLLDEVRDAESVVFTYRKDLKKMSMRLKQQHNLYQVRSPQDTVA